MKTHDLKTWPEYFKEVVNGVKTFEIRRNDRNFKVGDILNLREYHQEEGYTGRNITCSVVYMIDGPDFPHIDGGYCVMGISIIEKEEQT